MFPSTVPVHDNSGTQIYFKCETCGKEYKYVMGDPCPHCGRDM